jgi:hypothetical protein
MERAPTVVDPAISKVCRAHSATTDRALFVKELVYEILHVAGYKLGVAAPTPIERLSVLLGMDLTFEQGLPVDARSSRTKEGWHTTLSADQAYSDGLGQWLTARGRFTLAHEVAHVILERLGEISPDIVERLRLCGQELESSCDFMAAELLLPSPLFASPSFATLLQQYDPGHRSRCAGSVEGSIFPLGLLEAVASTLQVSRIALVRALDKTLALDQAECGIIVSFFGVNRNTGRSPALRVYKTSVPSWGFIPQNIKVSSIGLRSAVDAFHNLRYGVTMRWKETLTVSEKDPATGKWISRAMQSWGEHGLYPLKDRERYLVSTLKWPRAEQPSM